MVTLICRVLLLTAEKLDKITEHMAAELRRLAPVQRTMVLDQLLEIDKRAKRWRRGPSAIAAYTAIRRDGVQ